MSFNYGVLRAGDYVLTTSRSALAALIRERTAWPCNPWNVSIATHAAIVCETKNSKGESRFYLAEMLSKLRCSPITDYLDNGFWGSRIVCIRRNPVYNNLDKRKQVNDRILDDLEKQIKYDYFGIAEYLFSGFKDNNNRFYCSEYLQRHAILDGNPIKWKHYNINDPDDIPPRRIQLAPNLVNVDGW